MKMSSAVLATSSTAWSPTTSWKSPPALDWTNYTKDGVEKAIGNYWTCVERLAKEKADLIIFSGAPISAMLDPAAGSRTHRANQRTLRHPRRRAAGSVDRCNETSGLDELLPSAAAGPTRSTTPSFAYLAAGGIEVVGITKRNQWASDSFAMSLEQGLEMALEVGREAANKLAASRRDLDPRRRRDGAPRDSGNRRRSSANLPSPT